MQEKCYFCREKEAVLSVALLGQNDDEDDKSNDVNACEECAAALEYLVEHPEDILWHLPHEMYTEIFSQGMAKDAWGGKIEDGKWKANG